MFHVLILRRRTGTGWSQALLRKHAGYLDRWHANGMVLASGHIVPESGGEVVLAVGDRTDVEAAAAQDPLVRAGVAAWEILTVDAARVREELAEALAPEPTEAGGDTGWDTDALRELRGAGAKLAGALAAQPISSVLQHVGQALLGVLAGTNQPPGASQAPGANQPADATQAAVAQARRCVAELRERYWTGDDILACELSDALGETVGAGSSGWPPWPLQPVPVDLEDLASFLDGDPRQGSGVVDLSTGEVLPPGVFEFGDVPAELDEDNEAFDPDRWLSYRPDSGEGYRDMVDFITTVGDGRLRDRLERALDGRGPFRRFRDVLDEAPEAHLQRWYVFRDERALGRARTFLAGQGYRATPGPAPAAQAP